VEYKAGTNNLICDICGFKIKASEARKTWDNLIVCPNDYEPKHPQLFPRPKFNESRIPPLVRPEATDSYGNYTDDISALTWDQLSVYWNEAATLWNVAGTAGEIYYSTAGHGDELTTGTSDGGGL